MTDLSFPPSYPISHNLLKGKNVVITAAAGSGIGFAAAKRCVEEGAKVLISDIHERRLIKAAEKINKDTNYLPEIFLCDVTDGKFQLTNLTNTNQIENLQGFF